MAFFICLECDIFSPSDFSLTGKWDCELLGFTGISTALLDIDEESGRISGNIKWNDLNLPVKGTVNSKRQVNIETKDPNQRIILNLRALKDNSILDGSFSYYLNNLFMDGGSVYGEKR